MATLAEILGIDPTTPQARLAVAQALADRELLRDLVRERVRQRLSQQDVADRLGISQPTVAAFERHDSDPKLSTIRRYAQAIGVMVNHEVSRRQYSVGVSAASATTSSSTEVVFPSYQQRFVMTGVARVSAA